MGVANELGTEPSEVSNADDREVVVWLVLAVDMAAAVKEVATVSALTMLCFNQNIYYQLRALWTSR